MAHEILSVKLYELDQRVNQLHSRIQSSEPASWEEREEKIRVFQKECIENKMALHEKLRFSKSEKVRQISEAYDQIETIIEETQRKISASLSEETQKEMCAEELILLAEYSLDFAMQAADDALLVSMRAIQKQKG